ncbi:hypothetical protein ACWCXH_37020 [Kitasatospora sp. NPDC001660]
MWRTASAIRNGGFEDAVIKTRAALDAVREACDTKKRYSDASEKEAQERDQADRRVMLIRSTPTTVLGA